METCKNCGNPLILSEGRCIYCQQLPDSSSNQSEKPYQSEDEESTSKQVLKTKKKSKNSVFSNNQKRGKNIRRILNIILFLEIVLVSIAELRIDIGLGYIAAALLLNFTVLLMASDKTYDANQGNFEHHKSFWRIYHEYLHFFVKMIEVLLGYLIVAHFQGFWAIFLLILVAIFFIVIDCIKS